MNIRKNARVGRHTLSIQSMDLQHSLYLKVVILYLFVAYELSAHWHSIKFDTMSQHIHDHSIKINISANRSLC